MPACIAGLCVNNCPVHARDGETRTDVRKCVPNSFTNVDFESILFNLQVQQRPPDNAVFRLSVIIGFPGLVCVNNKIAGNGAMSFYILML